MMCVGGVGEEGCAHECSARIGQKSVLHLLELELQVVVSQLMWILECKCGSSARGIYAPDCWEVFLVPELEYLRNYENLMSYKNKIVVQLRPNDIPSSLPLSHIICVSWCEMMNNDATKTLAPPLFSRESYTRNEEIKTNLGSHSYLYRRDRKSVSFSKSQYI